MEDRLWRPVPENDTSFVLVTQYIFRKTRIAATHVADLMTRKFKWSYTQSIYEARFPTNRPTILELLGHFHHLECSGPRDRLHALASLDPDLQLPCAYSLTYEQTCVWFAQWLIQQDQFLDVLYSLSHQYQDPSIAPPRASGLPSWVPDLKLQCDHISECVQVPVQITIAADCEICAEVLFLGTSLDQLRNDDEHETSVIETLQDPFPGSMATAANEQTSLYNVDEGDVICALLRAED